MITNSLRSARHIKGKTAIVRCGFNVPFTSSGVIADDLRLRDTLPTITWLLQHQCKVVLIGHRGRPAGKKNNRLSLKPVAHHLANLLDQPVYFIGHTDLQVAKKLITQSVNPGEIAVLENIRFYPGEEKNLPSFAKKIAELGDFFVLDAFSDIHRHHASIDAIQSFATSYAGLLLEREITVLQSAATRPPRPYTAIIGGAKLETKIPLITALLPRVDHVMVAGGVGNTFLAAAGLPTGKSLLEPTLIPMAKKMLQSGKIILPTKVHVRRGRTTATVKPEHVRPRDIILDADPFSSPPAKKILTASRLVVWNGTLGYIEKPPFDRYTRALLHYLGKLKKSQVIIGGGETASVAEHVWRRPPDHIFISTGGGAMISFLEHGGHLSTIKKFSIT